MNIYQYKLIRNNNDMPELFKEKELTIRDDKKYVIDNIGEILMKYLPLNNDYVESSYIISTDVNDEINGIMQLSKGDHTSNLLCYREIFIYLLLTGSSGFIKVHNHPNHVAELSDADKADINVLSYISELLKIKMIDYMILTDECFYSAYEEGYLIRKEFL